MPKLNEFFFNPSASQDFFFNEGPTTRITVSEQPQPEQTWVPADSSPYLYLDARYEASNPVIGWQDQVSEYYVTASDSSHYTFVESEAVFGGQPCVHFLSGGYSELNRTATDWNWLIRTDQPFENWWFWAVWRSSNTPLVAAGSAIFSIGYTPTDTGVILLANHDASGTVETSTLSFKYGRDNGSVVSLSPIITPEIGTTRYIVMGFDNSLTPSYGYQSSGVPWTTGNGTRSAKTSNNIYKMYVGRDPSPWASFIDGKVATIGIVRGELTQNLATLVANWCVSTWSASI